MNKLSKQSEIYFMFNKKNLHKKTIEFELNRIYGAIKEIKPKILDFICFFCTKDNKWKIRFDNKLNNNNEYHERISYSWFKSKADIINYLYKKFNQHILEFKKRQHHRLNEMYITNKNKYSKEHKQKIIKYLEDYNSHIVYFTSMVNNI